MNRKSIIRKCLAVGIILLFVGVTVAQGITSNTKELSLAKNSKNIVTSTGKTKLSCCYFTSHGVEQVVNEVTVQDANYLSQLMNGSDVDAIISELNRLNLLPKTVSIEQTKELVSGRYGKKIFQRSQKISHPNQSLDTDWKENFNCNISGHGVDAYFMTPRMYLLLNALDINLFLFITLPATVLFVILNELFSYSWEMFIFLASLIMIFSTPQQLVEIYLENGQFINPIKLTPGKIVAELYVATDNEHPFLNTSGTNGIWNFSDYYRGIAMYMEGFYGIWLSIHDGQQLPGTYVKGFCSYIKAKGMNDWPWDGWGDDWPWSSNLKRRNQ